MAERREHRRQQGGVCARAMSPPQGEAGVRRRRTHKSGLLKRNARTTETGLAFRQMHPVGPRSQRKAQIVGDDHLQTELMRGRNDAHRQLSAGVGIRMTDNDARATRQSGQQIAWIGQARAVTQHITLRKGLWGRAETRAIVPRAQLC